MTLTHAAAVDRLKDLRKNYAGGARAKGVRDALDFAIAALSQPEGDVFDAAVEAIRAAFLKIGPADLGYGRAVSLLNHLERAGFSVVSRPPALSPPGQEGDGWLPWASAPIDGRTILAWRKVAGEPFTVHFANSRDEHDIPFGEHTGDPCWFTMDGEDLTGEEPTQWRPLPAPPKDKP